MGVFPTKKWPARPNDLLFRLYCHYFKAAGFLGLYQNAIQEEFFSPFVPTAFIATPITLVNLVTESTSFNGIAQFYHSTQKGFCRFLSAVFARVHSFSFGFNKRSMFSTIFSPPVVAIAVWIKTPAARGKGISGCHSPLSKLGSRATAWINAMRISILGLFLSW